jgi:hypothetical protein
MADSTKIPRIKTPLIDPYASDIDRAISVAGWFTPFLADLNQRNPFVANFLIQHAIWSYRRIWHRRLAGRYVFLQRSAVPEQRELGAGAPNFQSLPSLAKPGCKLPVNSAFFAQNNFTNIPFKHNTQGVTDQPLIFFHA